MSDLSEQDPPLLANHYTCHYCRLEHRNVEAGGVWYCPNPLCNGPGSEWFNRGLPSYRKEPPNDYTVDPAERRAWAMSHIESLADDDLRARILAIVAPCKHPTCNERLDVEKRLVAEARAEVERLEDVIVDNEHELMAARADAVREERERIASDVESWPTDDYSPRGIARRIRAGRHAKEVDRGE